MPKVSHVREEFWDEATREFRFKSLPTVPDLQLSVVRNDLSVPAGDVGTIAYLAVPPGSVLRVTLLRYLSSDPRGALFMVTQNGSLVDTPYLPSVGETLVIQDREKPVYVFDAGVVAVLVSAILGSIYAGTVYGVTMHGYYSKQEELKQTT